jgi:hypothetical protein
VEVVAQNEWLETQLREANEADVAREARRYGQELARLREEGGRERAALEAKLAAARENDGGIAKGSAGTQVLTPPSLPVWPCI